MDLSLKPKLRWPLDIQYIEHEGNQYALFRDPLGAAPEPAIVPLVLLPIVGRFDGNTQLTAILEEAAPKGLSSELLHQIVRSLDELLYLENEASRSREASIKADYRETAVREPALAGRIYPEDRATLTDLLDAYLKETRPCELDETSDILALAAPHIDYERGWHTYAVTAHALRRVKADVIFLFGTAHQPGASRFQMTTKDFRTPLGVLPCAKDIVKRVSAAYGETRAFADEILHKQEHSLELQLPFIQHVFRRPQPQIVPVLVNSFHEFVAGQRQPLEDEEVRVFVQAMAAEAAALSGAGKKVLLFGGVDLAHVGLQFGDKERVGVKGLEALEFEDRRLIETLLTAEPQTFFDEIIADGDKRRICGASSLYTMLAVMKELKWASRGKCLEYRQSLEERSDCIVTFASLAWVTA